jgi:hypothetical protein
MEEYVFAGQKAYITFLSTVVKMEIISIVASIVSVIIGGFAIWLSVTFYKWSSEIAKETGEAAKSVSAGVERLEALFDKLYTGTFTVMADTVSDMRKHMWPSKDTSVEQLTQIENRADEKISNLKLEVGEELSSVIHQLGEKTDQKIAGVEKRLAGLIDKAIQQTRQVETEAQEERHVAEAAKNIVKFLLSCRSQFPKVGVSRIIPQFAEKYSVPTITSALVLLQRSKLIEVDGSIEDSRTLVSLSKSKWDI